MADKLLHGVLRYGVSTDQSHWGISVYNHVCVCVCVYNALPIIILNLRVLAKSGKVGVQVNIVKRLHPLLNVCKSMLLIEPR